MLTLKPRRHAHAREGGTGKVRDVVELAVLRVRQDRGGFDPARLFLDLERCQRRDLAARMEAERPGWPPRLRPADRFARLVCELAEGTGPMALVRIGISDPDEPARSRREHRHCRC